MIYLPVGSFSYFKHLEARDFLSKDLHGDGHQQAAVISVAAGGVYHQEYHQEDHHDDGNHVAFGHAAHFELRGKMKELNESTNTFCEWICHS